LPLSTPAWISPAITKSLRKPVAFALLALPFIYLIWLVIGEVVAPGSRLGPDAGEAVVLYLGDWSMWLLLITLAITSVSRRLKRPQLISIRRMAGLFAFACVALHFLSYLTFLVNFDWPLIVEDLTERRYITVGFAALLLLLPLALTSTRGWQRRLGKRWKRLHRLIYLIVLLGLVHVFWLTKDGYAQPMLMLAIFSLLMLERFLPRLRPGYQSAN
jgi:methionine sulfoxide reductase heme-binding subunit